MRWTGLFLPLIFLFFMPQGRLALGLGGRTSETSMSADRPLKDEPKDDGVVSQIKRLILALKDNLGNYAFDRSAWYDRYSEVAQEAKENSEIVDELRNISRLALPIIWHNFVGSIVQQRDAFSHAGSLEFFDTVHAPRKHPILDMRTHLTTSDDFTVEFLLSLRKEANIGLRLHLLDADVDRELDWDNDDILFSAHFRRTYHTGDEKQIVLNEKYNGDWGPNHVMYYPDTWPNIQPNEMFRVMFIKVDNCITMRVLPGEDAMYLMPMPLPYVFSFCYSKDPYSSAQRRLKTNPKIILSVNEDEHYDGIEVVDVHKMQYWPVAFYL
ncbi:uncharacterized protein LOC143039954 [Oratosquilla oratoria]|uniref:uncharacterized protein LOC143039954 n=1 Tax=Oratosquilla oratoria TaxID=337810 RepID=UPI003F7589EA